MNSSHPANILELTRTKQTASTDNLDSVESLYRQHWGPVCRRLKQVFGMPPPEPEDLAQEAFARLLAMPDVSKIDNPRAYLTRAAINIGLNSLERIKTLQKYVDKALLEANSTILKESGPEDVYMVREKFVRLRKVVRKLNKKQRSILLKSRFRGKTYAQISAETGWSQADISRQLNKTLAILQDSIHQHDEGN